MTKQKMLERLANETARAWFDLAMDLELRCPRRSVRAMFDFQENDEKQSRLRCKWYALNNLFDEFGGAYTDISDRYYERAYESSSRVYRECEAAENK